MEERYELQKAFEIISCAGDSRGNSTLAVKSARAGDYARAEEYLAKADETLTEAHRAQTELLQYESQGNALTLSILLVHAQDHLSMAMVTYDNALETTNLYHEVALLKEKIGC